MSVRKLMRLDEPRICLTCDQALFEDDDYVLIKEPDLNLKIYLCGSCLEDFYREHQETVQQCSARTGAVLQMIKPRRLS
jgi:hypothetical protein